ncbi:DUF72 domain-containing protein [Pseudoxanthomonas gei]|uniref:DUF72 domain-containing protein n=1 Tax=Pseudoxanthomonas gei TaxID=1383030 RepID=A0ABX0AE63_9GAMM|nr:DUF72 domain-containing protein [Pseudoxanthomonas gei]NDK39887.1 DUF72 domain-containing protein [Pseudoxanthomonas gei]
MTRKASNAPDLFADLPAFPAAPRIRVGIGGWTYVPWRGGMFYPVGLVQRRELEYASRQLTSIEVNGTYYGAQKPATYAKWRDETPEGFLFSAKAPQRIMESRALAKTAHQIEDFIGGIVELGDKLGPLVWQFDKGRRIDGAEFAGFVESLPAEYGARKLRHVLDVRDPGFVDADYLALARKHGMATVFTDSEEHPSFADLTADFVYARLMRSRSSVATGYPDAELATWCQRALRWAQGEDPQDLPHLASAQAAGKPRDVFIYFISSAKERNPAAAMALLQRLGAVR